MVSITCIKNCWIHTKLLKINGEYIDILVKSINTDFEKKLNNFLKDSEDKLTSIKRQTESRRGGRGARR